MLSCVATERLNSSFDFFFLVDRRDVVVDLVAVVLFRPCCDVLETSAAGLLSSSSLNPSREDNRLRSRRYGPSSDVCSDDSSEGDDKEEDDLRRARAKFSSPIAGGMVEDGTTALCNREDFRLFVERCRIVDRAIVRQGKSKRCGNSLTKLLTCMSCLLTILFHNVPKDGEVGVAFRKSELRAIFFVRVPHVGLCSNLRIYRTIRAVISFVPRILGSTPSTYSEPTYQTYCRARVWRRLSWGHTP